MLHLPNTTGPDSNSSSSGEIGDIAAAFAGQDYYQELIGQANTVPIIKIFQHYNVRCDAHSRKTTCPFKSHKGGRERTPSFWFYPDTNTYCCFGCRNGSRVVDFVAEMERCSKEEAAFKVLQWFGSDVDEDRVYSEQDFGVRLNIMMDFANTVREFHQTHSTEHALSYVEPVCRIYDTLNLKRKLDNVALQRIVEQLKEYLIRYKA